MSGGKKSGEQDYKPPFDSTESSAGSSNGSGSDNPLAMGAKSPDDEEVRSDQPANAEGKPQAGLPPGFDFAEFAHNIGVGMAQANKNQAQQTILVRDEGDERERDVIIEDGDYIPEGYSFFASRMGLCMSVERRGGKDSRNPLGRKSITFQPFAEQKYLSGKEENVYRTSQYITHSLKEKAWIRESPLFKLIIFDNSSGAMTPKGQLASQLISSMQHMQNMSFNQVVAMCAQYDVLVSDDIQQMRTGIAGKLAERMFSEEVKASSNVSKQSQKIAMLFKEGRTLD